MLEIVVYIFYGALTVATGYVVLLWKMLRDDEQRREI
jgi:hypothetical protein